MSILASVGDGVFLGDGGVFQECCCHVVFLSLKRSAAGESIIVAIEDAGTEGHVMWVKEIDPASDSDTFTSMWSNGGNLFLAIRPATVSDPSVFKIKESNGTTLASLALTEIVGGGVIRKPAIAVNTSGQVFVVADRSHAEHSRDCFRLDLSLNLQLSVKALSLYVPIDDPTHGVIGVPLGFGDGPRHRVLSLDSGGAPCISSVGNIARLNTDFTNPYDPTTFQWFTAEAPLEPLPGGFAPNVHRGGPDVLALLPSTSPINDLVNFTSFHYAKTFITRAFGTFSNTRVNGFGDGVLWVPASSNTIRRYALSGPTLVYSRTLGTDFLTDGTWGASTSRLDLLRQTNGGELWVLARDLNAGNKRAVLAVFQEGGVDGSEWAEKWRLDLMTDTDVAWSDPTVADHWRGWVLNSPGQGFDG